MKKLKAGILALFLAIPLAAIAQQPVYLDPSQPIARRVDDLIARLTLEEKTSLLSTTAPAIDRLKIPAMNGWNQSLHGIVWTRPTTMFPVPISMAVMESGIGAGGRRRHTGLGPGHLKLLAHCSRP